jgi:hypothetical protein
MSIKSSFGHVMGLGMGVLWLIQLQAQAQTYYPVTIGWGHDQLFLDFTIDGTLYPKHIISDLTLTFTDPTQKPAGYATTTPSYCVDVHGGATIGTPYYTTPVTPAQASFSSSWVVDGIAQASYLYNTYSSGVTDGIHGAALQLAIWDVLENGTKNDGSGTQVTGFSYPATGTNAAGTAAYDQARAWASEARGKDPSTLNTDVTIWQNSANNDGTGHVQGLIGPVPEPGQIGLAMAVVLGLWAGIKRFRKQS